MLGIFGDVRRACMVEILVGAELGRLDAQPEFPLRRTVAPDDMRREVDKVIRRYSDGASIVKTRGFYLGQSEPGVAIRIIGSPDDAKLLTPAELLRAGMCIAAHLHETFFQWEVWMLFHDVDGAKQLFKAGVDPWTKADDKACSALRLELSRRRKQSQAAQAA